MNKTCSPENDKAKEGGSSVVVIDSAAVENFSERYGVGELSKVMSVFSWVAEHLAPASAASHSLEASDPAGRLDHGIRPWCTFKDMSIEHSCFTCVASGLGSPSPGIQVWQQVPPE